MPLSTTIITSKYGLRRVKTLPSNMAIAFIEETYEEGFGPANLVQKKQENNSAMIRFETKKSQHPSGKYLNYTLVTEKITPIQGVKIKGMTDTKLLVELESISYTLSKGKTIYGDENSFSGSVVFGKPLQPKSDKTNLSSIAPKLRGKGITLLNKIFEEVKSQISFSDDESYSFSSAEDQISESATLEVRQNKYLGLRSLTDQTVDGSGNFYSIKTETASFDGNGNILGSIVKSYKPKNSKASINDLKNILEQDIKSSNPPTKVIKTIKDLGYKYDTNAKFYQKPVSAQYSLDGASLNGNSIVTFTNATNFLSQGYSSNTIEEIIEQQIPKGNKLIVRGTVTGLESQSFDINNNKKFDKALAGLKEILQKYEINEQELNKHDELKFIDIKGKKGILTNVDINYGISDGAINFSISAEQRNDLSEDKDFLYLNVSWLEPQPVHWANSFLILGGKGGKGEELMQDSKQSRPLEYVLRFSAIMAKYDKPEVGYKKFQKVVEENKKKILKSASCSYSYASKSLEGTAVFIEFDKHREIKDDALKSSDPKKPK